MNLNNDVPSRKTALSFVALAMIFTSSCSSTKDLPVFIKADTVNFSEANSRIKIIPATTAGGSENIVVDIGHGVKTGASITFSLNFAEGGNFKTKANKPGNPAFLTSDVKSIKVWLVELNTGSTPSITAGQGIPSISGSVFAYNNSSVNPQVTFTNVPPNTTGGPSKSYYVAASAHNINAVDNSGSNLNLTNNISNTISAANWVMIDGTFPAAISILGGDGSIPIAANAGSVIVGPGPNYTVSSNTGLQLNLKLQDEIGASIETNITAQAGSAGIPLPNLLNLSGFIDSVAGIGNGPYTGANPPNGDGGPALQALLNSPNAVVVDSLSNIYIADTNNCTIRKIDTASGNISVVAGINGQCGSDGDGVAIAHKLKNPMGLAIDSANNIYIADTGNHTIRKFSGTSISTIAGTPGVNGAAGDNNPATSATLKSPEGVAVDSGGNNIYIADTGNNVIRIVSSGGPPPINLFAGTYSTGDGADTGLATNTALHSPSGVAFDSSGKVFIADTGNNIIRMVSGGNIFRAAGNSSHTNGNSGDGGQSTSASLDGPKGIALDINGNFFISDTNNHKVRKVNFSNGVIKTYAGTGSGGFNGDGQPATTAQLKGPAGIFITSSGYVYISDTANQRIRRVF